MEERIRQMVSVPVEKEDILRYVTYSKLMAITGRPVY
jgi:hypothetical protein